MFYPVIEFLLGWLIRSLFRILNKFRWRRVKTLPAYVELHSGPDFLIHYKHAFIINSVWVTMLLGPGFPILFPISFLSMLILYISEKLMLAYSCRKPPMYDETLNKSTISHIWWSPILYAFSASW